MKRTNKVQKKQIIILVIVFVLCIAGLEILSTAETKEGKIAIGYSSSEIIGSNVDDIESGLKEKGFTNIVTTAKEDLIIGFLNSKGEIDSITVGNVTSFGASSKFAPDTQINITYHDYPQKQASDSKSSTAKATPTPKPTPTTKPTPTPTLSERIVLNYDFDSEISYRSGHICYTYLFDFDTGVYAEYVKMWTKKEGNTYTVDMGTFTGDYVSGIYLNQSSPETQEKPDFQYAPSSTTEVWKYDMHGNLDKRAFPKANTYTTEKNIISTIESCIKNGKEYPEELVTIQE